MKKFLLLVAVLGGVFYYRPDLIPSFGKKGAFDKKGNPVVLVFTGKECPPCVNALQDLRERNVAFEELPLDDNRPNIDRYESLGGNGTIPLIAIGKETLQGWDRGVVASVLGATFGDRALTPLEQMLYNNHFNSDGTPRIFMYGASWCGYCKKARAELESRHIPYAEIDADASPDKAMMFNTLNMGGYPLFYVGYTRVRGARDIEPVLDALSHSIKRH